MQNFKQAIVTHGGAGSNPKNSDETDAAANVGMDVMGKGASALAAVVQAVKYLEDDQRFNAGTGSHLRADGKTVQMDASCMTSDGKFGAVACLEGIINPIGVAHTILRHSSHILLVGDGARSFATEHNLPQAVFGRPVTRKTDHGKSPPSCDTVGAVAFDGTMFAAALSTGGLKRAAIGRVGDVPLPGCGLFCGPAGAVACTGDGESIALKILAKEVYGWLEQKMSPDEAAHKAMRLFDSSVDVGLIVLTGNDFSSISRNGMAWSHLTEVA
ncbi:MAG: isoaspartyl peptidase/L-asparaginase [Desulforhopalus sp.]